MNTHDVIEHHGVKGMKWGQRAAKKISSGIDRFMGGVDKLNKAYANTHRGMLDDYSRQMKYNHAEWKAVQRKTRKHSFSPLTKKTLQRQKEEYAKLKSYKDEINRIDYIRKEHREPRIRDYVKKEHLAEYDKMRKVLDSYSRPHYDGPRLKRWDKAYDRQVELTKIGMDHHYAKAAKAYNDYVNK
nr:MAG TPA: hypothetical protein [Caudoviricetes sp.]